MKIDKKSAQLLRDKGLKITKVRMVLLQHFMELGHAQSYNDLQLAFANEYDKSTIYRNLATFEEAEIIHRIHDHSGMTKYAFGESERKGNHHAHFVCNKCEVVYCLDGNVPVIPKAPEGFKAQEIQILVKGTCANC